MSAAADIVHDMFAAVHEQQGRAAGEGVGHQGKGVDTGSIPQAEGAGQGRRDNTRIGQRGKVAQVDPALEVGGQTGRHFDAEAGLAPAARPDHADQAAVLEQLLHRLDVVLPSHERHAQVGQVVGLGGRPEAGETTTRASGWAS